MECPVAFRSDSTGESVLLHLGESLVDRLEILVGPAPRGQFRQHALERFARFHDLR